MFRQLSRQTVKALPRSRFVSSRPVHSTLEQQKKERKTKWTTSYSKMTQADAEERLGVRLELLATVPAQTLLDEAGSMVAWKGTIKKIKEQVYSGIVGHLRFEGYPWETNPDFKEANINDLVYITLHPILSRFIDKTGRCLRLQRKKEIVAVGGTEEFVVVDLISLKEDMFLFVIEAKKSSLGEAVKQCLLAMKDMRDNNGGQIYGFVTTGESWRMLSYDGTSFRTTPKIELVLHGMDQQKTLWMKDYSILVDCIVVALSNGANVQKDLKDIFARGPKGESEGIM